MTAGRKVRDSMKNVILCKQTQGEKGRKIILNIDESKDLVQP